MQKAPILYLFLDYDGTLTPIVKKPELANLSPRMKLLLTQLVKNPKLCVAIVSGRSIKQLTQKIKIKNLTLAGNHGLEIKTHRINYIHPQAKKYALVLKKVKKEIAAQIKPFKGAFVENKGLTLSVHFRMVKKGNVAKLKLLFRRTVSLYVKQSKIKITTGKKVLEVRPPVKWDKGALVSYLLKKAQSKSRKCLPIYIGDDKTDESAFKKLRKIGITIFVGNKRKVTSNAQYYLKDVSQVYRFLKRLTFED